MTLASSNPSKQDFIGCVALPMLRRDVKSNLQEVLALWSDKRFTPVYSEGTFRPTLLVVLNNAEADDLADAEALFKKYPSLHRSFSGFVVRSADLSGDRDLYARNSQDAMGEFGNKAGPNFLFQKTMEIAALYSQTGGFTLQLELDCLPVSPGWIEQTNEVIAGNCRAWVIGSIFAGPKGLDRSVQTHLNGNAIYKTGDPAFIHFLQTVWMPDLLSKAQRMPNLAYDCWWAIETQRANGSNGNAAWLRYQIYESFFRNDPLFVNLLGGLTELQEYITIFQRFAALRRKPVFFHGAAMRHLLKALLEHPDDTIFAAINRVAQVKPDVERPSATVVPMVLAEKVKDQEATQVVAVSGFHGIEASESEPADCVWTAAPRFVLALLAPQRIAELRFHTEMDAPPQFEIRNSATCQLLQHSTSWDSFNQIGTMHIETSGRAEPAVEFLMMEINSVSESVPAGTTIAKGKGILFSPSAQQRRRFMDALTFAESRLGTTGQSGYQGAARGEIAAE